MDGGLSIDSVFTTQTIYLTCFFLFFFNLAQVKRSKGLKLFDLDKTVSEAVNVTLRYQLTSDGAVRVEVRTNALLCYVMPWIRMSVIRDGLQDVNLTGSCSQSKF